MDANTYIYLGAATCISEGEATGFMAMIASDLTSEEGSTCPSMKEVCRYSDAQCLDRVTKLQVWKKCCYNYSILLKEKRMIHIL